MIKTASQLGVVPNTWVAGDTKTLTYDGNTYTARLVDTTGKFLRSADNSVAYLSFELTSLLSVPGKCAYDINNNPSPATATLIQDCNSGTIWSKLDTNLTSILEPVLIKSGATPSGSLVEVPLKIFLPRAHDINYTSNPRSNMPQEWNAIVTDEYYILHNSDSYRVKSCPGCNVYWTMSINLTYPSMALVWTGGGWGGREANVSSIAAVGIRFAL